VRGRAARLGVIEITQQDNQIIIKPETLDIEVAGRVASKLKGRCMVNAGQKPYFSVKILRGANPVDTIREAVEAMAGSG
jgi:transcription-repair coupling factor (superfamily II helicase)